MQGFLINQLAKKFGEEKLITLSPMLMATGALLMPSFQDVLIFFFANSLLAAGFGIINTAIPAFLSKRISLNKQGSILGIASSIASVANIPGPLMIGVVYDFAGSFVPFLISALVLVTAFIISCKVYRACKILN
jgi:cyanate permease